MKVAIFGAGQAGAMAARWLPSGQELVCFIDNNKKKQGQSVLRVPVCSLEQALKMHPDKVWIAVLNREVAAEIALQIEEIGFTGEVITLQTFRERQDIRLASLRLLVEGIKQRNVPGEAAELGVYQGVFAAEINRLLPEKKLYLFDTFCGFDERDIKTERKIGNRDAKTGAFSDTGVDVVRERLPHPEQTVFCPGYFPESVKELGEGLPRLALVSLDPDLYGPAYEGLRVFYPLLSPGGVILIHDYNSMQFPGVKKAVEKFCEEQRLFVVPLMDLHGSAVIIKS